MGWLVKHIMTNFLYNFGGDDRKQEDGGPMGDDLTQAISRMIGSEYDELFVELCEKLAVELELYERFVDDQNVMGLSFGRTIKFCPEDGRMVNKTDLEIIEDRDKKEDEIFMEELRKIADSIIPMLKTEVDSPARHPELGFKVPILDLAVWVEEEELPAPGMESRNLHTKCVEGECLPIGEPKCDVGRMEGEAETSTRMVTQVNYQFYSKPSSAKTTILSNSANPWQQKRTAFTQEVIRRLLRTRCRQTC